MMMMIIIILIIIHYLISEFSTLTVVILLNFNRCKKITVQLGFYLGPYSHHS